MNLVHSIAKVCSALSHPSRVEIFLRLLANQENGLASGQLSEQLDIPPSTLSHHLREMENAGVISRESHGRQTLVTPECAVLNGLVKSLSTLCCAQTPPKPAPNDEDPS